MARCPLDVVFSSAFVGLSFYYAHLKWLRHRKGKGKGEEIGR